MKVARLAPLLAVLPLVGYFLGGCGGGNGVPALSGAVPSGALPEVTATRPEVTIPTIATIPTLPTVPTRPETNEETTAEAPEETTTQPPTKTVVETETVAPAPTSPAVTETGTVTGGTQTVAVEPASSESSGAPWGWIILGLALLGGAAAVAFVTLRRRRGGS